MCIRDLSTAIQRKILLILVKNHSNCTGREIICDTVKFIPKRIEFPQESLHDRLLKSIDKILHLLQENINSPTNNLPNSPDVHSAFSKLAKLFRNKVHNSSSIFTQKPRVNPLLQQSPVPANTTKTQVHPEPRVKPPDIPIPRLPPLPKLFNVAATSLTNKVLNHIYDANGNKQSIDGLLSNPQTTATWSKALENELGRLAQGYIRVE